VKTIIKASTACIGRSYNQYCGVAHSLDLVGERWTLLIVRNLLLGPQRYTELQRGLPGITTNLLAKRLKEMEEQGLIEPTQNAYRPVSSRWFTYSAAGAGHRWESQPRVSTGASTT
jgi:DNA-binding HxlR family transcriptional regulator